MFKILMVVVVVALIAQSTEARKKKPTKATTTTTTTTTTAAPAPASITTIWEDKENVEMYVSGFERSLASATRKFFDKIGYKYDTKEILQYNIRYLLDGDWATVNTTANSNTRYNLQKFVINLHPLSNAFY